MVFREGLKEILAPVENVLAHDVYKDEYCVKKNHLRNIHDLNYMNRVSISD